MTGDTQVAGIIEELEGLRVTLSKRMEGELKQAQTPQDLSRIKRLRHSIAGIKSQIEMAKNIEARDKGLEH